MRATAIDFIYVQSYIILEELGGANHLGPKGMKVWTALWLWLTEVLMYSLHRLSRDVGSAWQRNCRRRSHGVRTFDIN